MGNFENTVSSVGDSEKVKHCSVPSDVLFMEKSNVKICLSEFNEDLIEKENLLKNSKDISEDMDFFDLKYVEEKFSKLFEIDIDSLGESFTEKEGKYEIKFQNLSKILTNGEKIIFNNLRTLYILFHNQKSKTTI